MKDINVVWNTMLIPNNFWELYEETLNKKISPISLLTKDYVSCHVLFHESKEYIDKCYELFKQPIFKTGVVCVDDNEMSEWFKRTKYLLDNGVSNDSFYDSIVELSASMRNEDSVYYNVYDSEFKHNEKKYHKSYFFKSNSEYLMKDGISLCQLADSRIQKQITKKTKNKREPIDSRLRHEVFKRDKYKCVECGKTKEEVSLHCDHILPVSQGGTDELDNLRTLCRDCNLAKSNKKW